MAYENVDSWMDLVKSSLDSSDPIYGKQIFVSGIHESKTMLLVDNDTDNNYAIVSVVLNKSKQNYNCTTVELISSTEKLATMIEKDHEQWLSQWT